MSGSFGHVGCFSTHPLKNLNACGDGGFLTTDDRGGGGGRADAAQPRPGHARHRPARFGQVSRMDSLQAAILHHRLGRLDDTIAGAGKMPRSTASGSMRIASSCPAERERAFDTYHTFVVQVDGRDRLQAFLKDRGVGTAIHYPVPIHLQPAAESLGYRAGDFPVTERQAGTHPHFADKSDP